MFADTVAIRGHITTLWPWKLLRSTESTKKLLRSTESTEKLLRSTEKLLLHSGHFPTNVKALRSCREKQHWKPASCHYVSASSNGQTYQPPKVPANKYMHNSSFSILEVAPASIFGIFQPRHFIKP